MKPDLNDVIAILGLVMLTSGIWWLSPPWALIITGTLILILGVARSRG